MRAAALLIPAIAVAAAAQETDPVELALGRLGSPDPAVCRRAMDDLDAMPSSVALGLRLIAAAGDPHPGAPDASERLLARVRSTPRPEYVAAVESVYDRFEGHDGAREAALRLLAEIGSRSAYDTLARLLRRRSSRSVDLRQTAAALREAPDAGLPLLPVLYEVVPRLDHPADGWLLVLRYAEAGKAHLGEAKPFAEAALRRTRDLLPETGEDLESRREASILVELARFVAGRPAGVVLDEALRAPDPGIRARALASRLGRGDPVHPAQLESMAAAPVDRAELWEALERIGRLEAFPARQRNRTALAEADLARWLASSAGGFAPETIEALGEVVRSEGVLVVLRFRHPSVREGQWLAGVAGPFRPGVPLGVRGKWTGSLFDLAASATIEEHARAHAPR